MIRVIDLTFTVDTAIYADNEVLADTQDLDIDRAVGARGMLLHSLVLLDESDQGIALDLIFLNDNVSIGTENSAVTVTDENARAIIGRVPIASGDYYDLGGARIVCLTGIGLALQTKGSRNLYVAAVSRGAGTYAATALKAKFGFLTE